MCGICGFVNIDGEPASATILRRMRETIAHRGPDDAGEYIDGGILTTRYTYALTLNGSFVTGTVKTQIRSGEGTFEDADVWRFKAERLTGFQPH